MFPLEFRAEVNLEESKVMGLLVVEVACSQLQPFLPRDAMQSAVMLQ